MGRLPSPYDYGRRPDYVGQIGEALGPVAKTVNDWSEAHPLVVKALRRIYPGGEDPRTVAIETKFAMSRQQPPPNLPDAGTRSGVPTSPPGAPAAPRRLVGRMEDTTGNVGMRGSMRSSMDASPPPSSEELGLAPLEETITAPPPALRGSRPLMSEPSTNQAFYSQGQPPILNRDLPVLMQGANLVRKDEMNDLGYLNYLLGRDRLTETTSNRLGMQPGRDARTDATRATTANMPFKNEMQRRNLGARWADIGVKQGNLDTRRTENYLKGAGPSLEITSGLGSLIQQGLSHPEIVGTQGDYAERRIARVMGSLPLFGNFAESALTADADQDLTFAQREFKRRLQGELSTFIHSRYGSALTAQELAQAQRIAGGEFSIADTLAGAQAVYYIARRKGQLYERAYPDVAGQVGQPGTGPSIPFERMDDPAKGAVPVDDLQYLDLGVR